MIVTVTLNPGLDRTLTVSEIRFNEVLRARTVQVDCGGKGFNVSRALAALGVSSLAIGFVGGGTGEILARGLAQAGIATDLVHVQGESRTATVIQEESSGRYVKVNEPGPPIQPEELAALRACISHHLQPGDIWTLCGSLPPGVPVDFYGELIRMLQSAGARVFLDASGEPLRRGCSAAPFLVKPNLAEAAEVMGSTELALFGREREVATYFLEFGIPVVALSLGARGLWLATRERSVWAEPPPVQVRHTVGSGDALLAALAWAFGEGLPLEEVARWGVACGTAAAMHEGVTFGSRAEVEALYKEVRAHEQP